MTKKDEKLENGVTETVENVDTENGVTDLSEPINIETLKSTLVRLETVLLEDSREIIAAILKDGRLNTKNTTRSYLVALSGPELAVQTARDLLSDGDLTAVSGSEITWERTTYAPGSFVKINGETRFVEEGLVVDHIMDINLEPIKTTLFMTYLKVKEITDLSPLMEKILLKGFNIDLN